MSQHPFMRMFDRALKKSSRTDNHVLTVALTLREKGYPATEILSILETLKKSLIDDAESAIVGDAYEAFLEGL